MIFLGIILAALAATGAIATVTAGANHHTAVSLTVFGQTLPATSAAGVFLVGAAIACVFLLGCSITAAGFRRGARVRRELQDLRDEHDESLQTLAAQKAQLERELARERRMAGHPQSIPGRPLPGAPTGAQPFPGPGDATAAEPFPVAEPFPGAETGPVAGGLGRAAPPGPRFPGPERPRRALPAEMFRRPGR